MSHTPPSPPEAARRRYERNKQVAAILSRHAADMTRLTFSCSAHGLSLGGHLCKQPSGEFSPQGVEALLRELEAIPPRLNVSCALANWDCALILGAWQITPRQSRVARARQAEGENHLLIKDSLDSDVRNLLK